MTDEADYRNITSEVRTPRFAVLIDENNPYWRTAVSSLIRIFSQTWGGKYFLIVPTDGKRIKDKYWELLEAYNPDSLGTYQSTLADLQEAHPERYASIKAKWRDGWKYDQDFDEWFEDQQYHGTVGRFEIETALEQELKNRLAPFHHGEHIADRLIRGRGHGLGYPFTEITKITPHAHRPIEKLVLPKHVDDLDLRALVLSGSGDLDKKAVEEYAKQGVATTTLPDDYETEGMVQAVMAGAVSSFRLFLRRSAGEQPSEEIGPWSPDEDYVRHMPFQASMLHLARYYRLDTHHDYQEPVVAVVGDTVEDFCLYYCLSRLHDGVYWLPKKWLEDCYRRDINNTRLYRKGRPQREHSENALIARVIVNLVFEGIGFGHGEKKIELRSASLSAGELKKTARLMDRVHWGGRGEFAQHTVVKGLAETSTSCVARVMEENNYSNQQEMVFIDGRSVGQVSTPKPKNFSLIDPAEHRWLTSLRISGYTAPSLPFLGRQIASTHESRVAIDGVVYLCPNIGYFGGDIDVTLVRPKLVMVPALDIMRQHFAEAGLDVQSSDKGNYLTDTIHRFGDLATAAAFIRESSRRAILDLFLVNKSADDGYVVYLQEEQRAFVNYDGVHKCVGSEAAQIIDELVGRDVLKRGLVLLCNRCRLASWYDLANLTARFTCRRCGQAQQFTKANWKSPEEPKWYYALAETVYQCYKHNSHLTILALDHLRARSKESFQYLPEIDVIDFPRQDERHEIDIACFVDNLIVIGECKTGELRANHVNKYEALARALPRRPDEIVFATSNTGVSEAFHARIDGMVGGSILTAKELLGE
jgi:hypothetical protein